MRTPPVLRPVRGLVLLLVLLPAACAMPGSGSSFRGASLRFVPERSAIERRDTVAVETVLGRPARVRSESPAEVWQYVTGRCVLDVTFYPGTGTDRRLRAEYLESRGLDGKSLAVPECLASFAVGGG